MVPHGTTADQIITYLESSSLVTQQMLQSILITPQDAPVMDLPLTHFMKQKQEQYSLLPLLVVQIQGGIAR